MDSIAKMPRERRWNILPADARGAELAARLRTSPLIAQMLLNRGISTFEQGQAFLTPSLNDLHNPALLPGIQPAAERIARAIRDGESIVIYGDYDVDGITATAILWHAIKVLGGNVDYYIPHRIEEGYGVNAEAITQLCEAGHKLIVTVDCGVTAIDAAKIARDRGVDLIITDHHEWKHRAADKSAADLPECHAIVHPRLPACGQAAYPNPHLCGAGVAFKLAWEIGKATSGAAKVSEEYRAFLLEATALAALGTIADVVPLKGENRVLAHFGLKGLVHSRLTGIQALLASAKLAGKKLDAYHVGFLLAPRLNACGRMGHAREAVEMLTRADRAQADKIAADLERSNRQRQAIEKQIAEQAIAQVAERNMDRDDCRGFVLGMEGWHAGVIGIVASRIVGRFHRPTVMVALNNGHGQGSGRSIAGFHLAQALQACVGHLQGCGGHEMAAGLSMDSANFEAFRNAFEKYAMTQVSKDMLRPELRIDAEAEIKDVGSALIADLERLGPFGQANARPMLCCMGVEVAAPPRRVGADLSHLQMTVRQNGKSLPCIAFRMGNLAEQLCTGQKIDIAIEAEMNEYNGRRSVQLQVRDIRFAGQVNRTESAGVDATTAPMMR